MKKNNDLYDEYNKIANNTENRKKNKEFLDELFDIYTNEHDAKILKGYCHDYEYSHYYGLNDGSLTYLIATLKTIKERIDGIERRLDLKDGKIKEKRISKKNLIKKGETDKEIILTYKKEEKDDKEK